MNVYNFNNICDKKNQKEKMCLFYINMTGEYLRSYVLDSCKI